ncbi:MAG: DNA primase [Clostridium sp.]|nr:DNA primase [Clostridium sp.]
MIQGQQISELLRKADMRAVAGRYVNLVERGDGIVGLCPFHRADTMTLIVDPTSMTASCSQCGRTLGPVDLVMEADHTDYEGAVRRILATVADSDNTTDPAEEEESAVDTAAKIFSANEFAVTHFSRTLLDTPEGRDIGLAYFRERGVSDEMIARFALGYSSQKRNLFSAEAVAAGHEAQTLTTAGLSVAAENGDLFDRYRGRVVYPIFTVTGRPVAFGARTLRTDKEVAKYVNSPESVVYSKSNELYGLYQAREAIVEADRCILVEGYMDVISMYQAGIRNVVASSGTSLTEGQVSLIKRFTNRITVIYDADAAGIKASVRSIDMLLGADFTMDIVSLPEGEDPDSFARTHTKEQIERYLADNAIDFVGFKLRLAADRIDRDPIERSRVIADIVSSITLIPDKRAIRHFVKVTSVRVGVTEKMLQQQVSKRIAENRSRRPSASVATGPGLPDFDSDYADALAGDNRRTVSKDAAALRPFEREVVGLVLRNALSFFCDLTDENLEVTGSMNLFEYVDSAMRDDSLEFTNPDFRDLFEKIRRVVASADDETLRPYRTDADLLRERIMADGLEQLRSAEDQSLQSLQAGEELLAQRAEAESTARYDELVRTHAGRALMFSPDQPTRHLVAELMVPHQRLSRIHSRGTAVVETEADRLVDLTVHTLSALKYAVVQCRIADLHTLIRQASAAKDYDRALALMADRRDLDQIKRELAGYIGDIVIAPRHKDL